jgi:hypothetical protein
MASYLSLEITTIGQTPKIGLEVDVPMLTNSCAKVFGWALSTYIVKSVAQQ